MSIFTKLTNWLYGTTPSTPKVSPTLLTAPSAKKPAAKRSTKTAKKTGKKKN